MAYALTNLSDAAIDINNDRRRNADLGFVAGEVDEIEPLMTATKNGVVEGVKYDRVGAVLVNAVQQQELQFERQEEVIDAQSKVLKDQETRLYEQKSLLEQQQSEIETLKAFVCRDNNEAEFCETKNN